MEPITFNPKIKQGSRYEVQVALTDEDENGDEVATDLTGYTFEAQLRKLPGDAGDPIATFEAEIDGDPELGLAFIKLTDEQTLAIPVDPVTTEGAFFATQYAFDWFIINPDGERDCMYQGIAAVWPQVTVSE